jgi:RNA polymerase sigma factor (sigma-70 family)
MFLPGHNVGEDAGRQESFPPTQWSKVVQAGGADSPETRDALAKLCQTYWYPLYLYVRRVGHNADDAQDLTQDFFAMLIEKNTVGFAQQQKVKFRSFLLVALKNFLHNKWDKGQRQKRGGGREFLSLDEQNSENRYLVEPADTATPEKAFERRWALSLLDQVLSLLEAEMVAEGKGDFFGEAKVFLTGEKSEVSQGEIAHRLGMTENSFRVNVHRLRSRYGKLLKAEVANTVANPREVEDEIRHLFAALS